MLGNNIQGQRSKVTKTQGQGINDIITLCHGAWAYNHETKSLVEEQQRVNTGKTKQIK